MKKIYLSLLILANISVLLASSDDPPVINDPSENQDALTLAQVNQAAADSDAPTLQDERANPSLKLMNDPTRSKASACVCNKKTLKYDCNKLCVKKRGAPWTGAIQPMKNGFLCLCAVSHTLPKNDNVYINCASNVPLRCGWRPFGDTGKWSGAVKLGKDRVILNQQRWQAYQQEKTKYQVPIT